MTSEREIDLVEFARRAFESLGGVFEQPSVDEMDVLLPGELAPSFRGRDLLKLHLSTQTEAGAEREPLLIGSAALDGLTGLLSRKGDLAKSYLNPVRTEGANLDRKLSKKIRWTNAQPSLMGQSQEETAHVLFCFKASFLTDDKTERFCKALVNLATGLENENLLGIWDHLFLDSSPGYALPSFPLPPLQTAYEKALESLRRKILPEAEKIRTFQKKFLGRDLARIDEYYRDILTELAAKERRVHGHGDNEPLLQKIEARKKSISLDCLEKKRDARDKHRLDVRVGLVNLLILYQPWTRALFRIKGREGEVERPFFWDPVSKDFLAVPCDLCGAPSIVFSLHDRRLICRNCQGPVSL